MDQNRSLNKRLEKLLKEEARCIASRKNWLKKKFGFNDSEAQGFVISALGDPRDIARLLQSKCRCIVIKHLVIDLLRKQGYLPRKKQSGNGTVGCANEVTASLRLKCARRPELGQYRSSPNILVMEELLVRLASFLESSGKNGRAVLLDSLFPLSRKKLAVIERVSLDALRQRIRRGRAMFRELMGEELPWEER